jgi:hypothetical protein
MRSSGARSIVPVARWKNIGLLVVKLPSVEPQRRQNKRRAWSDDANCSMCSLPLVKRKLSLGTSDHVANAAPVALRHFEQ